MFIEKIVSKVVAIRPTAKLSEQIEIIHKSKQDLCKLTKENLNLKSRLAILETKVFSENKSTLPTSVTRSTVTRSSTHYKAQPSTVIRFMNNNSSHIDQQQLYDDRNQGDVSLS